MEPVHTANLYIWIPVIAAIGGGLVSGIILLFNNWINKRSEEKKHFNEIMLNAALESWKQACDFAIESTKMSHRRAVVLPLEAHIIYVMEVTKVLLDKKITKENIVEKLKKVREICNEVSKFIESSEQKEEEKNKTSN